MIYVTSENRSKRYNNWQYMHPFVIVSNRLPVNVSRSPDGKLEFSVSSGGLATAMSSLDVENQIWIGWPGIASDELTSSEKAQIARELKKHNCYPVHLSEQEVRDFYEGYANDTLWPLFHYFQAYAQFHSKYWSAYKTVNTKFLRAVKKCAALNASVWIQDYQLMLLPAQVREVLPETRIGFFLHIPFPSYEIFRALPERNEIIKGLLGADLIGFHIYDYARHFISSCSRLIGTRSENGTIEYDGREIQVDVFPIGIDWDKYQQMLTEPEVVNEVERLSERYAGQKIVLSMDRLDYSKGILKRLEGYEKLLAERPAYRGKVTMIAIAVPSRTDVETYKKLRDEIEVTVSRINGTYSNSHWAPIVYQFKNLPFAEIVALMAKSDVALVTPLRDGMNLVAKEYVATKKDGRGVLVLSEMAGAVDELTDAVTVNPNDVVDVADSLHQALTMPRAEQRQRLEAMQQRISEYTVQKWGKDFIDQLCKVSEARYEMSKKYLTSDRVATLLTDYAAADHRLLMFDYDGTLRSYVRTPSARAAAPSASLRKSLATIAGHRSTTLCIVSGRSRQTLESWFGMHHDIVLVAEHGAWIKEGGVWRQMAESYDKTEVLSLMRTYASRTAGARVEDKDFAAVWHYRNVTPELAYVRRQSLMRELTSLINETELAVYRGNKIVEVKPRAVHKGNFVRDITMKKASDFMLCAGDDYTDEDMFKHMPPGAYSIKVGVGHTVARFRVSGVSDMVRLVHDIARLS